ncbi:MAG: type II toxin-antitoxin system PemK/MazF family toxin [Devosia sp.]
MKRANRNLAGAWRFLRIFGSGARATRLAICKPLAICKAVIFAGSVAMMKITDSSRTMAIQFALPVGTIVLCDYSLGGFRAPEMVKKRPAIILSPRLPYRDGLCTVVPISGSFDGRDLPYVVRLELTDELPPPFVHKIVWAKCDMLATVAFERLDMFRTGRD